MSLEKTTRQNRVREALGRIYEQQPPYFREYLRRYQEDPTSRVFAPLAEAYRRMGRVEEAIAICKEGLEHHPDFYGGRVALAKCFLDRKMYLEARPELERVVRAVPENLLAQRLLGDTHLALGDKASALHCYKMALLLSPHEVELAEKVHQLERTVEFRAELPPVPPVAPVSPEPDVKASDRLSSDPEMTPFWELSEEDLALSPSHAEAPASTERAEENPEPIFPVTETEEEVDDRSHANTESVNKLLGYMEEEAEAYKIESIAQVFGPVNEKNKEITTETLGDLYLSQGQHDRALQIFEKLYTQRPMPELLRKINICRSRLGVAKEEMLRQRQVALLQSLLKRVQQTSSPR